MKLALIITGLVLGLGAIAALSSGPAGWSQQHTERMRGSDAYYEEEQVENHIGPVSLRLNGDPEIYPVLEYIFSYRAGKELEDPAGHIAGRKLHLTDAIHTRLPEFSAQDLDTRHGKLALKRRLLAMTQEQLFPREEARVERIWFEKVILQPTRLDK
ncbi:MAG: hypothetical protein CMJ83_02800 [Planctomycetes bacterium]|nr:hypothetical protein [Planctomycetota bacterium]